MRVEARCVWRRRAVCKLVLMEKGELMLRMGRFVVVVVVDELEEFEASST